MKTAKLKIYEVPPDKTRVYCIAGSNMTEPNYTTQAFIKHQDKTDEYELMMHVGTDANHVQVRKEASFEKALDWLLEN